MEFINIWDVLLAVSTEGSPIVIEINYNVT